MWPCKLVYLLTLLIALPAATAGKLARPFNNSISAVFVFGDSTVDPGNNNNLECLLKSNFAPYGMDYNKHVPTGRFTDGRLLTDYLASYVGVKEYVPAYLEPGISLDEMMTGVSFASGGSGLDPLTSQISGVISIEKQMEYFKECKRKIEGAIGEKRTKALIRKAAFIISAGTNDIGITYLTTPFRRGSYTIAAYQQFLLANLNLLIQGLRAEGARVVAVVGLPPIGCLPLFISLYSQGDASRSCVDSISSIAPNYNHKLQQMLVAARTPTFNLVYADIYEIISELVSNPSKYGFDDVNTGCCGSGLLEASYLCNPMSTVCSDPSKHVFFDSIHPTTVTYYQIFKARQPLIDKILKSL